MARMSCLRAVSVIVLLIIAHHGDVVHSAALSKFQSVRFVTDNSLSVQSESEWSPKVSKDYFTINKKEKQNPYHSPIEEEAQRNPEDGQMTRIISEDIFWGDLIESLYPKGFGKENFTEWTNFINSNNTRIVSLDQDRCGRMQNRFITFADGTTACARYRQNTDQIQGELFSFFLGQLLNLTNMAPTALQIVNEDSALWADVSTKEAGWKAQRPVVLTKFVAGLSPAGIPKQFQKPLERHLNKFDVKNLTLGLDGNGMKNSVFEGNDGHEAGAAADGNGAGVGNLLADKATLSSAAKEIWPSINWFNIKNAAHPPLGKLIELAQWSDLVVFDYIIAHLDRVVNNLFNYQWNSEIMEAPAHNLAKVNDLLLFLDNESGLLHGYRSRLMTKYQPYHSLILENLCVFRRSTIDQLRWLETQDVGKLLNKLYLETTPEHLNGLLPQFQLPEKSIVILQERISQVLRHVDKCRRMFAK